MECQNLRELCLQDGSGRFANPICHNGASYIESIRSAVPQLDMIDGRRLKKSDSIRDSTGYYPVLSKYEMHINGSHDECREIENGQISHESESSDDDSLEDRRGLYVQKQASASSVFHAQQRFHQDQQKTGNALNLPNGRSLERLTPTPSIDRVLEVRRQRVRMAKLITKRHPPEHTPSESLDFVFTDHSIECKYNTRSTQTEKPIEKRTVGTDTAQHIEGEESSMNVQHSSDNMSVSDTSANSIQESDNDPDTDSSEISSEGDDGDIVEGQAKLRKRSPLRRARGCDYQKTRSEEKTSSVRAEHMVGKTVIDIETVNRLYEDLGAARAYIHQREQDLADAINRYQIEKKTLKDAKLIMVDRERKHKSTENRLKNLASELESAKEENNKLNQALAESKLVNERLVQQKQKLRLEMENAVEQIGSMREELVNSNNQIDSLKSRQQNKDYSVKYFELLKQLNALKLNAEKQEEQSRIHDSRTKLEHEKKIQELSQQHNRELSDLRLQIQESQLRFDRELHRMEEMCRREEEDKAAARTALDEAMSTILDLKKQVKEITHREMHTSAINKELTESMKKYKRFLDEVQKKRHEAMLQMQASAREHEHQLVQQKRLLDEIPIIRREKHIVEEELKRKIDLLEAAEKQIKDLEAQMKQREDGNSEDVKKLREENARLQDSIVQREQDSKILKTCNDDLGELISKTRVELESAKKENVDLQKDIQRLESTIDSTVEELSGKISRREDKIDELRERIHQLQDENKALDQESRMQDHRIEQENKFLIEKVSKLENRYDSKRRKYRDKIQALQSLLEQEKKDRSDLAQTMAEHLSNSERLKAEMTELQDAIRDKEEHVRQFKNALANKNAEMTELLRSISRMKQEASHDREQKTKAEVTLKQMEVLLRAVRGQQ